MKGKGPKVYLDEGCLRDVDSRLARIEGHVGGVRRMLDEQRPCEDILLQIVAVESALRAAKACLLEGHLECCISEGVKNGDASGTISALKTALVDAMRR